MVGWDWHRSVADRARAMVAVEIALRIGGGFLRALVRCRTGFTGEGRAGAIGRRRQGPKRVNAGEFSRVIFFPNDEAIVRLVGAVARWNKRTNGPSSAPVTRPWKPSPPCAMILSSDCRPWLSDQSGRARKSSPSEPQLNHAAGRELPMPWLFYSFGERLYIVLARRGPSSRGPEIAPSRSQLNPKSPVGGRGLSPPPFRGG